MAKTDPIITKEREDNTQTLNKRTWILVPIIAFGGVLIAWGIPSMISIAGTGGCVLASFVLAFLAFRKPKKDIVSLLTPLYAVLIFFNESFDPTLLLPIQTLYAASMTILVFRLNARFSRKDEVRRKFTDEDEEVIVDEPIPE
jgi:hypothetical protein